MGRNRATKPQDGRHISDVTGEEFGRVTSWGKITDLIFHLISSSLPVHFRRIRRHKQSRDWVRERFCGSTRKRYITSQHFTHLLFSSSSCASLYFLNLSFSHSDTLTSFLRSFRLFSSVVSFTQNNSSYGN